MFFFSSLLEQWPLVRAFDGEVRGGSKVEAASSHSPLQGATQYQIARTNQGIHIFMLTSWQYPITVCVCTSVHYTPWTTKQSHSFFLSLQHLNQSQEMQQAFFFLNIFLFLLHLAGNVCVEMHTHIHTHRLLKLIVLYIISYLVIPTFAANDFLAFILLCISPFQLCISAVITINTDFFPSCLRIWQCCKVQRQNTASEAQGMGVMGGGEQRNASFGCGATAQRSIMMFLNGGVCLVTQVPVQISIVPVAATLTAVESHWTLKQIVLLPRPASSCKRSIEVGPTQLTPLSEITASLQ